MPVVEARGREMGREFKKLKGEIGEGDMGAVQRLAGLKVEVK